jgi:hypothetical protein
MLDQTGEIFPTSRNHTLAIDLANRARRRDRRATDLQIGSRVPRVTRFQTVPCPVEAAEAMVQRNCMMPMQLHPRVTHGRAGKGESPSGPAPDWPAPWPPAGASAFDMVFAGSARPSFSAALDVLHLGKTDTPAPPSTAAASKLPDYAAAPPPPGQCTRRHSKT